MIGQLTLWVLPFTGKCPIPLLAFTAAKEALVQAQHFPRIPGTYKLLEVLEMAGTSSLAGSGINIFFQDAGIIFSTFYPHNGQ